MVPKEGFEPERVSQPPLKMPLFARGLRSGRLLPACPIILRHLPQEDCRKGRVPFPAATSEIGISYLNCFSRGIIQIMS